MGFDVFDELASHGQHFGAALQAGLVGNQARLGAEDEAVVDGAQMVIAQGDAGGNQVGDDVGVANGGCDFQGAFHVDEPNGGDAMLL